MICVECGAEMHKSSAPMKETFRGEELTITGVTYYKCDECGEVLFDAKEGKKFDKELVDQYAKLMGLLSPSEIRDIRKKYDLNQQEFEKVLGVSSPSVSRWETGKVIQSKPIDLLMRAYNKSEALMRERMEQVEIGSSDRANNVIPFKPRNSRIIKPYFMSIKSDKSIVSESFNVDVTEYVKEG